MLNALRENCSTSTMNFSTVKNLISNLIHNIGNKINLLPPIEKTLKGAPRAYRLEDLTKLLKMNFRIFQVSVLIVFILHQDTLFRKNYYHMIN